MLELRSVSKSFGGIVAASDISLKVHEGSIDGLIGPNGSGKTTLFNIVTGLYPPDAGEVLLDGRSLIGLNPGVIVRSGVTRTYQQSAVYEKMTCKQCMLISISHAQAGMRALFSRPNALEDSRANDLLVLLGLQAQSDQIAGELSYGQRKLLEIAMALMGQPKLLLLDEPSAGISPALIGPLIDLLKRINAELGVTLLIVEHNMRLVKEIAHEVHCLVRGRLLASGTPERVFADERVLDAYLGSQ